MVGPAAVALLLWVFAAPRSELVSVGGGRGVRLVDAGADGASQFLMLVILLGFSVVCTVLMLWRLHPRVRRPAGVPVLLLLSGLLCAVASAAATPLASMLASPPDHAPVGDVVSQAPTAGALFFGRMIYGSSGPEWEIFPPGIGWLVFGAMIAAFTVAALAHFSYSPDLCDQNDVEDALDEPESSDQSLPL